MKRRSKIGDFAMCTLALCVLVAFWLVRGWLVGYAAPAVITGSLYVVGLDKLGDRLVGLLPDWPLATATGVLVILCYRLVSRAWRRKRAIEEEIKPILDIQIGEPSPPGRVERFFSKDGPPDRLFNRCFGWIENIESDGTRFVVGFFVWTVVALPVGGIAMWLQRAQIRTLTLWEAIPVAFLFGSVWIFIALCALVTIEHVSRRLVRMRTWLARNLPRAWSFAIAAGSFAA